MDDQRVGAALRAVRIRRGWRQSDLAARAGVSASLVSLLERGHIDSVSVRTLRRVAQVLDVRIDLSARMRAGDIDRILNAGHAAMHEELAQLFDSLPSWVHAPEVSFAFFGERGIIDILAFHPGTGALLVIELKTEVVSFEDLLGTMDVRVRHARKIAAERGWLATSVSAWVIVADTAPNRRRLTEHRALVRSAFPSTGRAVRTWLRGPSGTIRALSLWAISTGSGANRPPALVRRVRRQKSVDRAA